MAMTYYSGGYEPWYSHRRDLAQSCYVTNHHYYQRSASWSQYGREYITVSRIHRNKTLIFNCKYKLY